MDYLLQLAGTLTSFNVMLFPNLILRWLTATSIFNSRASLMKPLLRLNSHDEFHISIFSDLHFGEEENGFGIDQDISSRRVMNNVLDDEKPDFVILNGDLITGENTFLTNSTKYIDVVVRTMVEHNVPWASTYGNHDSQFNLSREALFQEESKYDLSYTRRSPPGIPGITNYYVPIYPHKKHHRDIPVAILWFFDSQGGFPFQGQGKSVPNWVESSAADWFLSSQNEMKMKCKRNLPSLAFVHIPPAAFLTFQQNLRPNAGDKSTSFPGLNDDVPLDTQGDGSQDLPFMQALVDTKGLHSVYSGHDHGDAWCGNWPQGSGDMNGVTKPHLCFCKHTGYGGYGNWKRGSRNLMLSFRERRKGDKTSRLMDVETWVRMENGEVIQRVDLNSTYGVDHYSKVDGE